MIENFVILLILPLAILHILFLPSSQVTSLLVSGRGSKDLFRSVFKVPLFFDDDGVTKVF